MAWYDFLAKIPWWIYALIGIAVLGFLWHKLDYMTKSKLKKVLRGQYILPILFAGGWWFWASRNIMVSINQAHFWMPLIGLTVLLVLNLFGTMRYHTKQIITPNFHGSFTRAWNINGFVILNIGSFDALGLSVPIASKILVVREETFELCEDSAVSIARVGPVDIGELETETRNFIEKNIWLKNAKDNIFYGWFDSINRIDYLELKEGKEMLEGFEALKESNSLHELMKKEFKTSNPRVKDLWISYKNLCSDYTKLEINYKNVIKTDDRFADYSDRQRQIWGKEKERKTTTEGYQEN